ncbi:MAG: hypothetical protein V3U30_04110 [Thermoplasmata archaeon]
MIVRRYVGRQLLIQTLRDLDLSDVHLSEASVFRLSEAVENYGRDLSRRALQAFLRENAKRERLGIAQLRRLRDEDVEEALDSHEG